MIEITLAGTTYELDKELLDHIDNNRWMYNDEMLDFLIINNYIN